MEENSHTLGDSIWREVYLPYLKELTDDIRDQSYVLLIFLEIFLVLFGFGLGLFPIIIGILIGTVYSVYKLLYIPMKEGWLNYMVIYRLLFLFAYSTLLLNYIQNGKDVFYGTVIARSITTAIALFIPYLLLKFIPRSLESSRVAKIEKKYDIGLTKALVFDLRHIERYERALDPEYVKNNNTQVFDEGLKEKKILFEKLVENDLISKSEEITLWRSGEGFNPRYYLVIPVKPMEQQYSPLLRRGCPSINIFSTGKSNVSEAKYRRDLRKIGLYWDEKALPPTEFIDKISKIRNRSLEGNL